jgi:hypothetical protein
MFFLRSEIIFYAFLQSDWLREQYNAMQCNAMQCNAMQCNAMQCNAMQVHSSPSSHEPFCFRTLICLGPSLIFNLLCMYWTECVAYFFIIFNHFSRYVEENALLYWTVSLVGMQLREKYKEIPHFQRRPFASGSCLRSKCRISPCIFQIVASLPMRVLFLLYWPSVS